MTRKSKLPSLVAAHSEWVAHWNPHEKRIAESVMRCFAPPRWHGDPRPQVVDHYYCPMVQGGGGDWMQPGGEIANPYWGEEMLRCGELVREMGVREMGAGRGGDTERGSHGDKEGRRVVERGFGEGALK